MNEIKYQVDQYVSMCNHYDNFFIVDGDQPEEKVLKDVINTCLKKMSMRIN